MKRVIFLCFVTLLSIATWAADDFVVCLAVVEKNGEETYFALSKFPIITHSEGTINIKCEEYSIEDLSLREIEKLYHTESMPTMDGIGSINDMNNSRVDFTNGKALITGLKNGTHVYIYTSGGQIVGSVVASDDGNVCVDLNSLKCGQVYILHTPSTSYKIVK